MTQSHADRIALEISPQAQGAWAVFYQFLAATMQNGTALGEAWHQHAGTVHQPGITPTELNLPD